MNPAPFLVALSRTSCAAGVLVLLVLIAQRLFRNHLTPRWHSALWLLVAIRLLPLSLSSDVSLFNLFPAWITGAAPAAPPSLPSLDPEAGKALLAAAGAHFATKTASAQARSDAD